MARVIGIDLGTTNSCLAFMEGTDPQVIANREGARTTPSMVAVTESGERLVGQIAKRQGVTNPLNTVYAVKRLIGRKYQSPEVLRAKDHLPYELVEAPNGDVWVRVRGKDMSPSEVSAIILQEIRTAAEAYFGEEVTQAVITVPAYFNDHQRQATKDAGRIAGLEVLRIINEPTAACLAYNLGEHEDKVVAVYDLGGGTFDVSILRIGGGVYEVVATSGDTYLGGEDFDQLILEYLVGTFQEQTGIDLLVDKLALQRIKEAAEKAKCELSTVPNTEVSLPFISADATGPKHLNMTLTRTKLEELVRGLVDRTRIPCQEALSMAELTPDQVNEVLLVGGQTRMPMVQNMVKEIFGKAPRTDRNPDEVVAIGAAIQAGIIVGDVKDMVLLDVTPLSLGVATKGGMFVRLMERGSAIPTKKSRVFTTVADNQDTVEVHVLQGEREVAAENISLGKFDLVGIPPAPKGVPQIEVSFEINANGIVNVSAKDVASGREQKIVVSPSSGLSEGEIQKIIDDAHSHAEEDRQRNEFVKLKMRLEHQLGQNQKAFEEFSAMLPEEKREKASNVLDKARKAVASQSVSEVTEAMADLAIVANVLAEVMLYEPGQNAG